MKNITNKNLQRMVELMGIKKPINENINSSIEIIKKSPKGVYYGIVRENKKYFIKESNDGSSFDFIGGVANKTKNQFESYEQAVRRLNLMLEDTDVLTPDVIEEDKKFVIKTKKKKSKEEPKLDTGFDFGGEAEKKGGEDTEGFDFGGEDTESKGDTEEFDFGDEGTEKETEEGGDFDFGGEDTEEGGEDSEFDSSDEDYDLEDEGEDSIKSIQRMTGKLGQKLRDVEDLSSDTMKWVAKSVLSALDLEGMDSDDKKDLIRTIKKKKDEGTEEEFDFMDGKESDDNESDDHEEWEKLTNQERTMDYMGDEADMYGPGDGNIEKGEEVILDDEKNCSYCGDRDMPYHGEPEMGNYPGMEEDWMSDIDHMSTFAKNVKRTIPGRKMDEEEIDNHLKKLQNKLGGSDIVNIDDEKVVGDFGYIEVKPSGYVVYKEGEKFGKRFQFNELGRLKDYVKGFEEDYMEEPYMMPQPAPSRPQTRPETPVKPGRPDTDKPSPSKKPFTPPPFIRPGEEPNPKASKEDDMGDYGTTEGMDYMEDNMEICSVCQGKGHEKGGIGFKSQYNPCVTCGGTGRISRSEIDGEVDEPYTQNPFGYHTDDTMPPKVGFKYQYKEKFNFPFSFNENRRSKKTIKEDHINDKMASYEQEMAYEDIEDIARQHGMDVEFCHKDRAKDPEEQTVYLDLMKKGKSVATIRINTVGDIEMGHMVGKVFKGEPVDSHSDFDEVLGEKNIKSPMNPAPAPARPQTRPETPVKPGRPDTDKPSPSKRPFTPPPFIRPGEEPAPKAKGKK